MSGKKKTASKVEIYYIQTNPENLSVQELADELGLFKTTVEKHQAEVVPEPVNDKPPAKTNYMENFIITKTEKGGKAKVAIMTESGSERLDDLGKVARKIRAQTSTPGVAKSYPDRE